MYCFMCINSLLPYAVFGKKKRAKLWEDECGVDVRGIFSKQMATGHDVLSGAAAVYVNATITALPHHTTLQ